MEVYAQEGSTDNANNNIYFIIRNGYVSVYATDYTHSRTFACSIWYTSPNFDSFKATALAFVNSQTRLYVPNALISRDGMSTCTEFEYRHRR